MAMGQLELRLAAVERYFQSVRQAEINDYWARITRKSSSLLKYEAVAERLHLRHQIPIGHQMVRLDQIVGSVGRYREFTKGFYPRKAVLQDRWVMVDVTMNSLRGLPPVELYKVGDAYFVIDGNHRISVARANGNQDIEAIVIECQTNMPYTAADFEADQWSIKAAYGDFLAQTKLGQLRPDHTLDVTDAAHYATLLQHIAVHRYLANRRDAAMAPGYEALSWADAVVSWYDTVYMPVVVALRTFGLAVRFARPTETDLYVAITHYRERVAEEYGLAPLSAETAATVFAANHQAGMPRLLHTLRQRFAHWIHWQAPRRKVPAGMSATEFAMLRLRHDAGEWSVAEAGHRQRHELNFNDPLCEGNLSAQFSG
jgi:hypothetical protein